MWLPPNFFFLDVNSCENILLVHQVWSLIPGLVEVLDSVRELNLICCAQKMINRLIYCSTQLELKWLNCEHSFVFPCCPAVPAVLSWCLADLGDWFIFHRLLLCLKDVLVFLFPLDKNLDQSQEWAVLVRVLLRCSAKWSSRGLTCRSSSASLLSWWDTWRLAATAARKTPLTKSSTRWGMQSSLISRTSTIGRRSWAGVSIQKCLSSLLALELYMFLFFLNEFSTWQMAEKMGLIDLIKKIFRVKNSRLKILNPAASRSRKNSEFECACHVKNSSFIRIDRPDAAVSRSAIICFMGI